MKSRIFSLFVLAVLVFATLAASPHQGPTPPPLGANTPPWANLGGANASAMSPQLRTPTGNVMSAQTLTKLFPYLSGKAQNVLAPKLGITSLTGKKLDISKTADMDNIVNADAFVYENEPSLAVNPKNDAIVVAFHHYTDKCLAQVSFDGGDTFDYNNYVFLPLQAPGNNCSDPIVRFSPDGTYAYYFYMDIDSSGTTADIVMVRAAGYDPTSLLTGPMVVFNDYGDFLDKPWGDVAYYDTSGLSDPVIYVTSTLFTSSGGCGILFNASYDYGDTWWYSDGGRILTYNSNCNPLVQGSRPIGNPFSGWVSVCWYDSEVDGFRSGKFDIDCWSNNNWGSGGSSFWFTPVNDKKYELPYWLGPNSQYHRWWGGMFPALAVDNTGLLYIAYAADPNPNQVDAEAGNVNLARGWPNGILWTGLTVDGTSGLAQGFATVTARCDYKTFKCYSYVAYEDHTSANLFYRIAYKKITRPLSYITPGTASMAGKKIISDVLSFSDYLFIGDYIDSFVTARRYEVIWTDRSDATGIEDYDDDVMHDVLLP